MIIKFYLSVMMNLEDVFMNHPDFKLETLRTEFIQAPI